MHHLIADWKSHDTDLFLASQGHDAGFPVLDCAHVHVEAIYQASLRTT